jgi:hypothetical protein
LLPEFSKLFFEQVGTLQRLIKSEATFQAPGGVFLQVIAPGVKAASAVP